MKTNTFRSTMLMLIIVMLFVGCTPAPAITPELQLDIAPSVSSFSPVTLVATVDALRQINNGQMTNYVILEYSDMYKFIWPAGSNWASLDILKNGSTLRTVDGMWRATKTSPFTMKSVIEFAKRYSNAKEVTDITQVSDPVRIALANLLAWASQMGMYFVPVFIMPMDTDYYDTIRGSDGTFD